MNDLGKQTTKPVSIFGFIAATLLSIWLAHAVVFFAHEYAHSFVACWLGWKKHPLDLHMPPLSWVVWLLQLGIDQNVDEVPIFARGHGVQAGLISAAGMVLGNGLITLPLGMLFYGWAKRYRRWLPGMLAYWMCVASVGNFIDYVPIRTFTDGSDLFQDMYAVERGFGWSPWLLLVVFGIPTLIALVWLWLSLWPDALAWLGRGSLFCRLLLTWLTALFLFGFYGLAGLLGGGPVSHAMSMWVEGLVLPVALLVGTWITLQSRRA